VAPVHSVDASLLTLLSRRQRRLFFAPDAARARRKLCRQVDASAAGLASIARVI